MQRNHFSYRNVKDFFEKGSMRTVHQQHINTLLMHKGLLLCR